MKFEELDAPNVCKLRGCKIRGHETFCGAHCYPFKLMHTENGYWNINNVPKRYADMTLEDMMELDMNQGIKATILRYVKGFETIVDRDCKGLFLYSKTSGTGKTTTASIILNEYVIYRVERYMKSLQDKVKGLRDEPESLTHSPAYFINASSFQILYNSQFKGYSPDNAQKYEIVKNRMMNTDLLILDDLGIRSGSEAFLNELYDIIDYRTSEMKPMIITSNLHLNELEALFGQRIVSRLYEMCGDVIQFGDVDNRKVKRK